MRVRALAGGLRWFAGAWLAISLAACESPYAFRVPTPTPPPTAVPTPAPAPGPEALQVYFTAPIFPDKPAARKPSLNEKFVEFMGTARQTLDLAIFQLDLPDVVQALKDAQARGVRVRLVTDVDSLKDPKEGAAFRELERGGLPVVAGNGGGIMHNKFAVADGARVWTGSWNFTANDTWRYNNNALWIESPELADAYSQLFEAMHVRGQFARQRKTGTPSLKLAIGGAGVENAFAPEHEIQARIIARIQSAAQSVDFMAFAFTDDAIAAALLERSGAGVRVRGVFETIGSETHFSEYGSLRAAGLDVHQDGNPYLMHHKVFVVDSKTVIAGSYNFTASAGESNDENMLIIDDPRVAGLYAAEFERVLAAAVRNPGLVAPD